MGLIQQFKNTKLYLEGFSNELIKFMKIELGRNRTRTYPSGNRVSSPINFSKSLSNSLKLVQKESGSSHDFNITGNQYGLNVNDGRKAGSPPPLGDIVQWIKLKPVRLRDFRGRFATANEGSINGLANNIRRSIGMYGIKPTNFIDDAMDKSIEKLDRIGTPLIKDVELNLDDIFEKAGYIKKGDSYELKKDD